MKALAAQASIVEVSIANIDQHPQAQRAPSLYGVFTLIHNGKVLAESLHIHHPPGKYPEKRYSLKGKIPGIGSRWRMLPGRIEKLCVRFYIDKMS